MNPRAKSPFCVHQVFKSMFYTHTREGLRLYVFFSTAFTVGTRHGYHALTKPAVVNTCTKLRHAFIRKLFSLSIPKTHVFKMSETKLYLQRGFNPIQETS